MCVTHYDKRASTAGAYAGAVSQTLDDGPFFHGTKADLREGDFLNPGFNSNYRPEIVMNHIYFTALMPGAGLAAELALGEGAPRGNPTRSYRSAAPLKVVGEVTDWTRLTPEALQAWKHRLAELRADERGEIIN